MTVLCPQQLYIVAIHARRDIGLACARIFTTLVPLDMESHQRFDPDSHSPLRYLVSKSNMGDAIMFLATTVGMRSSTGNGMYAHVTQFTRLAPSQHYSICSDI